MAKLVKGVNDLATLYPDLVKEWNFEKNDIRPDEITRGSIRKIWWNCKKGHSWVAPICNRIKGSGCPYCSGFYVIKGETDLATTHPNLVKEWDYSKNKISPTEVGAGCNKKVFWKCEKGHNWETSIVSRVSGNYSCPYCRGRYVIKGETDLATLYPDLVKEWDFEKNTLKPDEVTRGTNKKVWWKCEKGHSFEQSIANRTVLGQKCPYCVGQRVIVGETDLATTHPHLLKEWDYKKNTILPTEISYGYTKKVWWVCEKGHNYDMSVSHKVIRDSKCPICLYRKVLVGYNDLQTTNPELIKEWDFDKNTIKPTEITKGYDKKVWWKCKNGHSFEQNAYKRISRGDGCPICSASRTEQLVNEYLVGRAYEREWVQKIGINNRRYDFYIHDKNVVIEVDGVQHFEESNKFFNTNTSYKYRRTADTQKNNHLLKLGIPLLRIPGLDMVRTKINIKEEDYYESIKSKIGYFLETRKIPEEIIYFYEDNSENNYAKVAEKMNELVEKGEI